MGAKDRSCRDLGILSKKGGAVDHQDQGDRELDDRVINHPGEGFCQHPKEPVDV